MRIYLSVYLSIRLSTCLSIYPFLYLFISLSTYLCVYLSICVSIYLFIYSTIYQCIDQSTNLSCHLLIPASIYHASINISIYVNRFVLYCLLLLSQESINGSFEHTVGSNSRKNHVDAAGMCVMKQATMKAITTQLMTNFDGTMKPLTFRQKLFYTDRQSLLEKKILSARVSAAAICDEINEMEVGDQGLKDIALMRR